MFQSIVAMFSRWYKRKIFRVYAFQENVPIIDFVIQFITYFIFINKRTKPIFLIYNEAG